ncbi:hypothetical protein [uncultured Hyphomicrobium sp.]|uniref:hypothetical protein n=1 Tax=uncultured Hyphomicrobium sp. TaxID=194373 RepID=UPI0025E2126B|nr:hypothetical protein [uncultured Hyphomicrobium sp.]
MTRRLNIDSVARIISDAGGEVVGRTKLQKLTYLLEAAGLGEGFSFEYKHYGPYSEELTYTSKRASVLGTIRESEQQAAWGGFYTIYSVTPIAPPRSEPHRRLAREAAHADSVLLELAATALFLRQEEGMVDAWEETARRKPDKASNGRLDAAKQLYSQLRQIPTPRQLPEL